jgi:anaerobic magnesium-protoporphyrin IX monomethyl ester cyclase
VYLLYLKDNTRGNQALERFSHAGISSTELFMVGYPGETIDDVEKMFDLVPSLPLDGAWIMVPLPLPRSPLFNRIAGLASWDDWQVSNQVKFVFPSQFDERWLECRIHETMAALKKKKGGILLGKTREG